MFRRTLIRAMFLAVLIASAVCCGGFLAFRAAVLPQNGLTILLVFIFSVVIGMLVAVKFALHIEKQVRKTTRQMVTFLEGIQKNTELNPVQNVPDLTLPNQEQIKRLLTRIYLKRKEARAESARAAEMLDNMSEGLVALDHNTSILIMNKQSAYFFDSEDENLRGQNLLRLTRLPRLLQSVSATIKTGKSDRLDWEDDVRGMIMQISVSAVKSLHHKEENGVILLITDVTAVRRMEKIRSEFVANASHELKTPLTAIRGFVELMETDIITDPDQIKDYLHRIHKETERMIELISDILHLSELEAVNMDTGYTTVSMKIIAQRAAESVALIAEKQNIRLHIEGDVGMLNANPDRMTQLALNLIDNAVKYNKPGGKVEISVHSKEQKVIFQVQDTGVGIPTESKQRVFERFYRVDKGRSRSQGGTGLGLSIVKHIVGLYKGHISIESEVGIGTTITVTLPVNMAG